MCTYSNQRKDAWDIALKASQWTSMSVWNCEIHFISIIIGDSGSCILKAVKNNPEIIIFESLVVFKKQQRDTSWSFVIFAEIPDSNQTSCDGRQRNSDGTCSGNKSRPVYQYASSKIYNLNKLI